jgi:hypothetical protein
LVTRTRRAKTRKSLTQDELKLAVHHIVYEWANLVSAGTLLRGHLTPPCNTHIQDAFLLGCRKLADFFLSQGKTGDEVRARDYFGERATPRFRLSEWSTWKDAMDKQLAHVTYSRIVKPKSWDGTRNEVLLNEFRRAWDNFRTGLEDSWRGEFDRAIDERMKAKGFTGLDLR